jgi:two-component system response regulator YesN
MPINLVGHQLEIRQKLNEFIVLLDCETVALPAPVDQILEFVHRHLFQKNLTVEKVKEGCGYANNNITTVFKQATGEGIREYIYKKRFDAAAYLLRHTSAPVYLIAESVCYGEESFSRLFKRRYSCTPSDYRGGG